MIKLSIENKLFVNKIKEKVDSTKEIMSPQSLQEISKAAFTITGEKFVRAVDRYAASNPKKMHHVYEWGKVGDPTARLFVIERKSILSGMLVVESSFIPSRIPVPVASELSSGLYGIPITARSIFRNKAEVMERNTPISFTAKKILTFMADAEQVFVAPGTKINIMHPGGISTRNAFAEFMTEWYSTNVDSVMNSSGLYEKIGQEIANVVNLDISNPSSIKAAIASATGIASEGKEIIR